MDKQVQRAYDRLKGAKSSLEETIADSGATADQVARGTKAVTGATAALGEALVPEEFKKKKPKSPEGEPEEPEDGEEGEEGEGGGEKAPSDDGGEEDGEEGEPGGEGEEEGEEEGEGSGGDGEEGEEEGKGGDDGEDGDEDGDGDGSGDGDGEEDGEGDGDGDGQGNGDGDSDGKEDADDPELDGNEWEKGDSDSEGGKGGINPGGDAAAGEGDYEGEDQEDAEQRAFNADVLAAENEAVEEVGRQLKRQARQEPKPQYPNERPRMFDQSNPRSGQKVPDYPPDTYRKLKRTLDESNTDLRSNWNNALKRGSVDPKLAMRAKRNPTNKIFKRFQPSKLKDSKLGIGILFDVSGSMALNDNTREGLAGMAAVVAALKDTGNEVTVMSHETSTFTVDMGQEKRLRRFLPYIGGNVLRNSLDPCIFALREMKNKTKALIFFTDGELQQYDVTEFFAGFGTHWPMFIVVLMPNIRSKADMDKYLERNRTNMDTYKEHGVTVLSIQTIGQLPDVFAKIIGELSERVKKELLAKP